VPLWSSLLRSRVDMAGEPLTGARLQWHGKVQHMHLDPHANPCAIWRLTPMETQS
jgi:starch synthase (maltosyl-transferring)